MRLLREQTYNFVTHHEKGKRKKKMKQELKHQIVPEVNQYQRASITECSPVKIMGHLHRGHLSHSTASSTQPALFSSIQSFLFSMSTLTSTTSQQLQQVVNIKLQDMLIKRNQIITKESGVYCQCVEFRMNTLRKRNNFLTTKIQ